MVELTPFAYSILKLLQTNLSLYLYDITSVIAETFSTPAQIMTTLYIIILGYAVLQGKFSKERIFEILFSFILICLFTTILSNPQFYCGEIVYEYISFVFDTMSFFSTKGNGANVVELFNTLDDGFTIIIDTLNRLTPVGNFLTDATKYFQFWFGTLILCLSYGLCYLLFICQICVPLFVLYILAVLGPYTLFFLAFKETRFIFKAWLKTIFQFSLVMIFSSIAMGLGYDIILNGLEIFETTDTEFGIFTVGFAVVVASTVIVFVMLTMASTLAAALTGSMQTGATGAQALTGALGGFIGGAAGVLGGKRLHRHDAYSAAGGSFKVGKSIYNRITKAGKSAKELSGLD